MMWHIRAKEFFTFEHADINKILNFHDIASNFAYLKKVNRHFTKYN